MLAAPIHCPAGARTRGVCARGATGARCFQVGCGVSGHARLLAGCGGSSSSSLDQTANFKTSYESVANQLKQNSQAIGTAIQHAPKQTDAQIGATFHNLASRWQNQLSQLQTLKPPSNLAASFNTVTGAASRVELIERRSSRRPDPQQLCRPAGQRQPRDRHLLSAKAASTVITDKLGAK